MMSLPKNARPRWEIFCRVVDNFGDIGVCWRLACDLALRREGAVRLWVDDWSVLGRICPPARALDPERGGVVAGVELRHWGEPFPVLAPGEVVIEAFACELPEVHLQAMAGQTRRPVWINLEYLSAEDWVAGCHGLASPHPRLPLVKHFFFPGFDIDSGGLLREADLLARRAAFVGDPARRSAWLAERGLERAAADSLRVSLFAYEQPGLAALLGAWQGGGRAVELLVPESRVLGDLARALGVDALRVGDRLQRGRLGVQVLPFTDQAGYDELLWACDLNFVRGEDSFVRAQWAAKPFVWQIYPQAGAAHRDKLDAFLGRYLAGAAPAPAAALVALWQAWNGFGTSAAALAQAWPAFAEALPALDAHARRWCERLAAGEDLVTRLTRFCSHIEAVAR
ncbi:elongation factor P maturation arginine rhamnosyltransferase EarP [Thauera aromatica]|uniref:Protein-arginine rhamnosyltransferase n=1 Tax=Thauera aromatica K172 TaxID=44139 RepID=A0A2R4BI60_THAAR|nr:hypothetical protein Tharo_0048 [Thauera aromatica K172]